MTLLHKVLLLGAVGAATLGFVAHDGFASAPPPAPPAEFTGKVVGWSATRLGDVAIRLRGQVPNANDTVDLWFVANADQTETIRFEQVMIEIALQHAQSGVPLTVVADGSVEGRGRALRDPIRMSAIRWEAP